MHSTTLCLSMIASSVLGLRVNFQRFSEPGCPAGFHHNTSAQHDMYIESNKGCKKFPGQVPFESFIADVAMGEDQMADNYCNVDVYESDNCTGEGFTMGDLECAGPACGTPRAEGGYHGNSARVLCVARNASTTPSVTTSQPNCQATIISPVNLSSSSSCKSGCKSTHIKTVTAASSLSTTHVQPGSINVTFRTSYTTIFPTTLANIAVCNMAPAVTASAKSVASASAAAMMMARRSILSAAKPSLKQVHIDDDDDDTDTEDFEDVDVEDDADDVVEEEATVLIFADIMKKLQDGCEANDE